MRRIILSVMAVLPLVLLAPAISIQAEFPGYSGGGLEEGVEQAEGFQTGGSGNVYVTVQNLIYTALTFLAIALLVVIIVAGITLLTGGHSDEQREKAKNMILYGIIGVIIVLFATAIVRYVVDRMFS